MIYHELRVYNEVSRKQRPLHYYRTPAGVEIDFVIETAHRRPDSLPRVIAVEVKRAERWDRAWEKPMRSLADNAGVNVERMFGVYCGVRSYQFDNVTVLPFADFIKALFAGEVF
jgi:hypothetical protein